MLLKQDGGEFETKESENKVFPIATNCTQKPPYWWSKEKTNVLRQLSSLTSTTKDPKIKESNGIKG